jgi:hypothetical protein
MLKTGLNEVRVVRRKELSVQSKFTVAHVPYLGFVSIRGGNESGLNFLVPPGDDIDQVNRLSDLSQIVRTASKRGYLGAIVLGPNGENSAAAAMSGALCLMPCHWAAYAAAIAKFTPLATYFAHPCCCAVQKPSVGEQLTGLGLDAIFYGTIAGLAFGAVRRVFRKKKSNALRASIDDCIDEMERASDGSEFCVVEEPEYGRIEETANSHGLSNLLLERVRHEYSRPPSGLIGKAFNPIIAGLKRAGRAVGSRQYQALGRDISNAYGALARSTRELAQNREGGIKSVFEIVARGYERESIAYKNSFNPKSLCLKLIDYFNGFSENNNWYRAV